MILLNSQENRCLNVVCEAIGTPLLLAVFSGCEALSQSYRFRLRVFSKEDLCRQSLIGQAIAVEIVKFSDKPRYFYGYIKAIKKCSRVREGWQEYQIILTSFLDWLDLGSDCRIFKDKTVPEIVNQLFVEHGVLDFKWDLNQRYQKLGYCVQYNETHLQFILRLLADAGIYFYFLHDKETARMIFSDSVKHYSPIELGDRVRAWREKSVSKNSAFKLVSYNFVEDKVKSVKSASSTDDVVSEIYPGEFESLAEGTAKAQLLSRQCEQQRYSAKGLTNESSLRPGNKFLKDKAYVVEKVFHFAKINNTETYQNKFFAVLDQNPYLSEQYEKPKIHGVQTALVCGPKESEIYCDHFGRVKVYFHWDRYRKFATWIRVAHPAVGKGCGIQFTPRVGQEVIVHFEQGDPNRPIIIGALYNGMNKPPFELPKNKTQSGIRSKAHEICFEDKKDKQFIQIKTKRDYFEKILGDRLTAVKNHQKIIIKGNALTQILKGSQKTVAKKSILLKSGDSTLEITPTAIKLNGKKIELN